MSCPCAHKTLNKLNFQEKGYWLGVAIIYLFFAKTGLDSLYQC